MIIVKYAILWIKIINKFEFKKSDYKESSTYNDKYIVLTVLKIIEIIKRYQRKVCF